jgi:hypothetical protein
LSEDLPGTDVYTPSGKGGNWQKGTVSLPPAAIGQGIVLVFPLDVNMAVALRRAPAFNNVNESELGSWIWQAILCKVILYRVR